MACSSGWLSRRPPATASAAFEHHAELPRVELNGGEATVLVGEPGRSASPGPARHRPRRCRSRRCDPATTPCPAGAAFEHALVVFDGDVGDRRPAASSRAASPTSARGRDESRSHGRCRGAGPSHRRRALRRAGADVVELRGPHPRRDRPRLRAVADWRRALRRGALGPSSHTGQAADLARRAPERRHFRYPGSTDRVCL